MEKSDIKTGMVVELEDGDKYIVLNTEVGKIGLNSTRSVFLDLSNYDSTTLKHRENIKDMDVCKIYSPKLSNNISEFMEYKSLIVPDKWDLMELIWNRGEKD